MNNIKKLYKKLFFILLILMVNFSFYTPTFASDNTPTVYAPSCILMDAKTGKILYSKNANEKMYPASTTKVMTAILTLEHCNLTDIVTVSHNAIHSVPSGYTTADLQEGEQLTVEQLLHVLLIPSANDAAYALAEHVGGSVDGFADMMNAKATELGCKNTHFVNPNGIQNENHYSTAYDLALIDQYAMKNDTFRQLVSTTEYTLPNTNKYDKQPRTFTTTNDLIRKNSKYYYKYAIGTKTGYTENAECCIIATAEKDDMELIAVILHDQKTDTGLATREVDCKTLFEYGFNSYSSQTVASAGTVEKTIKVSYATMDTKSLGLALDKDLVALIPHDYDFTNTTPNIVINQNIKAPIAKGDILGTATITVDGSDYTANLVATHDVYQFNFVKTSLEILLVIVLLVLFSMTAKHKKKKSYYKSKKKSHKKSSKNSYRYK